MAFLHAIVSGCGWQYWVDCVGGGIAWVFLVAH